MRQVEIHSCSTSFSSYFEFKAIYLGTKINYNFKETEIYIYTLAGNTARIWP